MADKNKFQEKLCGTPTPANIKWTELSSYLKSLGYEMKKGRGSRRKFIHADKKAVISCHQPHPSPDVDKGCVDDIVAHLKDYGFIKE